MVCKGTVTDFSNMEIGHGKMVTDPKKMKNGHGKAMFFVSVL